MNSERAFDDTAMQSVVESALLVHEVVNLLSSAVQCIEHTAVLRAWADQLATVAEASAVACFSTWWLDVYPCVSALNGTGNRTEGIDTLCDCRPLLANLKGVCGPLTSLWPKEESDQLVPGHVVFA